MDEDSVKQTLAWRIVRQLVDHVYGSDEKMSSDDFLTVYRAFAGAGGSWEAFIQGDIKAVALLESALDSFIRIRNTMRVAARVARACDGQYRSS